MVLTRKQMYNQSTVTRHGIYVKIEKTKNKNHKKRKIQNTIVEVHNKKEKRVRFEIPTPITTELFSEASEEYHKNKRYNRTKGLMQYLCGKEMQNGKICSAPQCCMIGLYSGCRRHYKWKEEQEEQEEQEATMYNSDDKDAHNCDGDKSIYELDYWRTEPTFEMKIVNCK